MKTEKMIQGTLVIAVIFIFTISLLHTQTSNAQLIGQVSNPPCGVDITYSGQLSNGTQLIGTDIGRAGGVTYHYRNFNFNNFDLYWGIDTDDAKIAFEGDLDSNGDPYEVNEVLSFSGSQSNLPNGIAVFTGTSFIKHTPNGSWLITPLDTRITITITDTLGNPLPLITNPESIVPQAGILLNVAGGFNAHMIMEAYGNYTSGWAPVIDLYDTLHTDPYDPLYNMIYTSFESGFYYFDATNIVSPIADVGIGVNYGFKTIADLDTVFDLNTCNGSIYTVSSDPTKIITEVDGSLLKIEPFGVYIGDALVDVTVTGTDTTLVDTFNVTVSPVLNLKVYLEGPFTGTNMSTLLSSEGKLPLSQPFNSAPWNYAGNETVTNIPNQDIVDWVLVEVRDTTEAQYAIGTTEIVKQAGFLLNDGSIVNIDGVSDLQFKEVIQLGMYIVIWHRNHLGIISSVSPPETDGVYSYDFSVNPAQAYGTDPQKLLSTGIYGMISGDGDANGIIGTNDKVLEWSIISGESGYKAADYNLDGQVNNPDKDDIWLGNMNANSQVPD